MNYLLIAITAYLLNAVAVTIDKILLVKRLPNPLLYVFYISVLSLVILIAAPFTPFPKFYPLVLSSAATLLSTGGIYFMFRALKNGEAARVIPVIGTLIPIILLFMSSVSGSINLNEVWAVILLVFGLILLVYSYLKGKLSYNEVNQELISALFFANSYFLLKAAYDVSSFGPVFIYSRLILIPLILAILIIPSLRKLVFSHSKSQRDFRFFSKTGVILLCGQLCGGVSQLLLMFAISLANPAVINSIQGTQYVFLFILGLVLAKKYPQAFDEKLNRAHLPGKIIGIGIIFFGLWVLSYGTLQPSRPPLGVTFSPRYAMELGLNPRETYTAMLTDINPGTIRIPVYWDEVEKTAGNYNFSEVETYITQAAPFNSDIILVLGFKQPRWPECYAPGWTRQLSKEQFNDAVVQLVRAEVEAFKKYPNIRFWQVENEPLVQFGLCPKPDKQRLLKEIQAVKDQDTRPIIITESGELSGWVDTIRLGDMFGTTLYRVVWSPIFGSVSYPWPPVFYYLKANLTKFITGSNNPTMIAELQAEPWPDRGQPLGELSIPEQAKLFPVKQLTKNLIYAEETRLGPTLFWGVEWWYFMKVNGVNNYWITAQSLFLPQNTTGF